MKGLGKKNIKMDTKIENKTKHETNTEKRNKTKKKKETKKETKKENEKNNKDKKKKQKKKKYDVNVISIILFKKLDELMADISKNTNIKSSDMIDYILIENQPSLKNPKMKTIQVLVYSYFMIRTKIDVVDIVDTDNIDYKINDKIDDNNNNCDIMTNTPNIQFVSALGKLKYCKDEEIEKMFNHLKSKYTIRKKKGIEYCKKYMSDKDIPNNNFFESNKKKDDLADSYLQAVQFMFKTKK